MAWRQPLTQMRTGSHLGLKDEDGLKDTSAPSGCAHPACNTRALGIEDVHHICFDCPLYAAARQERPELLFAGPPHFMFSSASLPSHSLGTLLTASTPITLHLYFPQHYS
jgi:hypothetical protein